MDFINSDIWKALLFDIDEREKYLVDLFREGDVVWNPDMIRGKLTELEFFKQIPQSLIASIIIKEANLKQREEASDGRSDESRY